MERTRSLILWLLLGVAAVASLVWLYPWTMPLQPDDWTVNVAEAEAIGLERLRILGDLPEDPYVTTTMDGESRWELRLRSLLGERSAEELRASRLGRALLSWEVTVWEPAALVSAWTYKARINVAGETLALEMRVPPDEELPNIPADEAVRRANEFLVAQGHDLALFDEPVVRSREMENRTDHTLLFRDRDGVFGKDSPYGLQVTFAGDRLTGVRTYFDDAERSAAQSANQALTLLGQLWIFLSLPLLPVIGFFFLRRYHAGEIGVRRAVQVFLLVGVTGLVSIVMGSHQLSSGWNIGVLTRGQINAVVGLQLVLLFAFPIALMSFLSWSVGESLCRERWGKKLAAFDALFQGAWANSTVARASLRGLVAGVVIAAGLLISARLLPGDAPLDSLIGPWWQANRWFSVSLVVFCIGYGAYMEIFGRLLMVSSFTTRLGRWVGVPLAVLLGAAMFFPPLIMLPLKWSVLLWLVVSASFVFLFLRFGLFTSLLAQVTQMVVVSVLPFLASADSWQQLQAALALAVVALPFLLSAKFLFSSREFEYRYEDVPPHVRRIAERERQRVELETARRIQSSILPDLPPRLNGVDLAHAYLPATEVGGDFYDVLALDDGRLALAVGDVAGHGVSSGLVMSMARSALAVQVTFDPEVDAVFRTMNRMVYQTARKRLLTTLSYALLDPVRRELYYGSAGHLFPYRIDRRGKVDTLESVAYPLGVRNPLSVNVRTARLEAEDVLFFYSDGVVEARREGSDEMFGFERLEDSLRRHAPEGPEGLRDGVLADVEKFTGSALREDDQTILALRLPAA
ncbi:MAG: PP2C family protein-serine/threonine phosphatase [Acidobacteriota bacterium]